MMNNLKQKLGKSIENRRDELTAMADKIKKPQIARFGVFLS